MCESCLIDGCKESVAPESSSSSELPPPDDDSHGFSISNHTSFSDFYFFKEPEVQGSDSSSENIKTPKNKTPKKPVLSESEQELHDI